MNQASVKTSRGLRRTVKERVDRTGARTESSPRPPADSRLADQVDRALRATGHPPLRGLEVRVYEGAVVLHGRVPSYYLKQLAQATAMALKEVCELRNDVEVACLK